MNKKGVELTLNTIIIAIIAILVLIVIVLFFTETASSLITSFKNIIKDVVGLSQAPK